MKTFQNLREHIIGQSGFQALPENIKKSIMSTELKTESFHLFFKLLYDAQDVQYEKFLIFIKSVENYLMQEGSEGLCKMFIDFYVAQYFQPNQNLFCPFFPGNPVQPLTNVCEEIITGIINNNNIAHSPNKKIDINDNTLLHYASFYGMVDIVELLISKGADVHAKNIVNSTPLHLASEGGDRFVVELLISKGADVNEKGPFLATPLHVASKYGHLPVVELLISKGADINAQEINGTPLHLASEEGHWSVVELLIFKGADIKMKDSDYYNCTILVTASKKGNLDMVKFLVSKGADVNETNSLFPALTPLNQARKGGHDDVAAFLISKGALFKNLQMKRHI